MSTLRRSTRILSIAQRQLAATLAQESRDQASVQQQPVLVELDDDDIVSDADGYRSIAAGAVAEHMQPHAQPAQIKPAARRKLCRAVGRSTNALEVLHGLLTSAVDGARST